MVFENAGFLDDEISAILKKSAKRLTLIDKEMTLAVAERIDEAVAKM